MKYTILLLALALTACGDHASETTAFASNTDDVIVTDQCLKREIFSDCMKMLPAGPVATKYNDWDEVVQQCGREAHWMSKRRRAVVKPECEGQ